MGIQVFLKRWMFLGRLFFLMIRVFLGCSRVKFSSYSPRKGWESGLMFGVSGIAMNRVKKRTSISCFYSINDDEKIFIVFTKLLLHFW